MKEMKQGYVHSWELVTAVDGPGTRLVYFMQGCPLRCLYCQNPDTWRVGCGSKMTVEQMMRRCLKYRDIFEQSGGGVTFTGGEPLLQADFLTDVLRECKANGIHTTLDTSGYYGAAMPSDEFFDSLDLVLLDIKSGSDSKYLEVTGAHIDKTLQFAHELSRRNIPVWVRFVLVPGLTDDEENIRQVGELAGEISSLERFEILPFHQLGAHKYDDLGFRYVLQDRKSPSREDLARARELLKDLPLK
jgi:pyruvate formate lyase activating enzyme